MAGQRKIRTLSIDLGGSGIKALVLDEAGQALSERLRVETPQPATPQAVLGRVRELARKQGVFHRVSMGFPGVVRQGVVYTAANLDASWIGFDLAKALRQQLGKPARVANDADIQGYGAISGKGVELVLTLGTGLGSALFLHGQLVPNLEVAHHPFRKARTYEQCLGKAALERMGRKRWSRTLLKAIAQLEHLFNYDRLYLGGGNTKHIEAELPSNVKLVPNVLGLLGGIALWRNS